MNKRLKAALKCAEKEWPVFPVNPGGKEPLGKLAPNGLKDATTDEQKVRDWWGVVPSANIGFATGRLFVVDLDLPDGPASWRKLSEGRPVPETLQVKTPSGGRHIYFRAPEGIDVRNSAKKLGDGIDVHSDGGYVLVPPSETDSGPYKVAHRAGIADAPTWLVERLTAQNGRHAPAEPVEGDIPEGQRNATLASLAGSMRRRAMGESAMTAALLEENKARCSPPLPEDEVRRIATSVARYPPAAREAEEAEVPEAAPLPDTPAIPGAVYETLPDLLGEAAETFQQRHERDVFLTAALPALGACMPNVEGYYGHVPNALTPHSYAAIVAGAAGGKSPVKEGKRLAAGVDARIRERSEQERVHWSEQREWAEESDEPFNEPEPLERSLLLPANTSAANFHDALKARRERALVVETEIDTLTNALGQEWGKFDDTLRKAYHHEATSYGRKSEGNVTLERPALSVVLSGTPNQFRDLMGSTENGLYSRFALYYFDAPPVWVSQQPSSDALRQVERFEQYAKQVLEMWTKLDARDDPIRFRMTDDQWSMHDATFRPLLREAALNGRAHLADVLKRAGIVAFRIAMTLTVLRAFESGAALDVANSLMAEDEDVQAGLSLATTYAGHSMRFAESKLQTEESADPSTFRIATMLGGVGSRFTSGEAYDVAETEGLDVSRRTLRDDLNKAEERGLIRLVKARHWEKTDTPSARAATSASSASSALPPLPEEAEVPETPSKPRAVDIIISSEDWWKDRDIPAVRPWRLALNAQEPALAEVQ